MGKHSHSNSGLGGFMNGASIRFSRLKNGSGGVDAWRDQLNEASRSRNSGGGKLPRTTGMKLPKVGSIHEAAVTSVQEYGVFVQLGKGDTYKDGMCHVSNIGNLKIETPREAGLESGMHVWVKIKDINEKELKHSVDMRFVDQRNGKDLDPYNGMAKIVDNFWDKGVYANKRQAEDDDKEEAPPSPADLATSSGTKRKADKSEESSISDSSEAKKVSKKLKKARKQLEKMKKKAEKVKSKADESDSDEKKKKKGKEKKKNKKKDKKDSSDKSGFNENDD